MTELLALVDFDNVPVEIRRRGAWYVTERLVAAVATVATSVPSRIRARLYGGWYDSAAPTRQAQTLAAEIFARPSRALHFGHRKVVVGLEMAYALDADPHRHLLHTFRQRGSVHDLRCSNPRTLGCSVADCSAMALASFLADGKCPHAGCTVRAQDLLYRAQQKLVDTMIASDLLHVTVRGGAAPTVALACSDEDLWPPIRTALALGAVVLHVHTKPGSRTPQHYCADTGNGYREADL